MATLRTVTVKSSGGDYSSASAAEAGEQGDLVALDRQLDVECYSFSDTTQLVIDGWTTDATRYIRFYTPAAERHDGKWNVNKYRLETTAANNCLEDYTVFEGLQISMNASGSFRYALNLVGASNNMQGGLVDSCIVKSIGSATDSRGIRILSNSVATTVRNTLVYDFNTTGSIGISSSATTAKNILQNCTVANCTIGYDTGYLDTIAENCLSAGNTTAFGTSSNWYTGTRYNSSSTATVPGTNGRTSQTFTFVDEPNDDYHLGGADSGARDYGVDLSASFTVDIDGVTRSGTWDIGADEYVAAGGTVTHLIGSSLLNSRLTRSILN